MDGVGLRERAEAGQLATKLLQALRVAEERRDELALGDAGDARGGLAREWGRMRVEFGWGVWAIVVEMYAALERWVEERAEERDKKREE